ncbi:MAG: hypothetical protein PHN74_01915 [Candidatus Pacebacteria bacterium]|nr:hypothetical protein [Candidatus Paceibacterota bacterium]
MTAAKKVFLLIPICLLIFYGLFLTHKINLVTADLGRHLKNGEMIMGGEFPVLKTNFYSFSQPEFSTTNHHWLSGALFFITYKISGFAGLSAFFTFISFITFLLFFLIARKKAGIGVAGLISLLIIPLLASRTEIRPEALSYLLAGIFLYILWGVRDKIISSRWLFTLPALQIFWVNFHIYFFMGILLIGIFWLESLINKELKKELFKRFSLILVLSGIACLINPFGIYGALAPLTIFQDYGYKLVENQSVPFMINYTGQFGGYLLFIIVSVLAVASFIWAFIKKRSSFLIVNFLLMIIFGGMAWFAIRNIALFGLFVLPVLAANISYIFGKQIQDYNFPLKISSLAAIAVIFIAAVSGQWQRSFSYWNEFGLGLESGNSRAAEFFKKEEIKGPIFNNYDIGGYLIYHLFPKERVFVDNRPEAYSSDFFQETLIPMQNNNDIWLKKDKEYNFNSIFFSYRDLTPWGQNFLNLRVNDRSWAPVFADEQVIIFVKRNAENKNIIDKYEIPREAFSTNVN